MFDPIDRWMIRHTYWSCAGWGVLLVLVFFFASWGNGEQWAPALGQAAAVGVIGIGGGLLTGRYLRYRH